MNLNRLQVVCWHLAYLSIDYLRMCWSGKSSHYVMRGLPLKKMLKLAKILHLISFAKSIRRYISRPVHSIHAELVLMVKIYLGFIMDWIIYAILIWDIQ